MSDNQKHEQRRFAIEGIKNTGFYYTKSLVDGKYKLPILYCLQLDGHFDSFFSSEVHSYPSTAGIPKSGLNSNVKRESPTVVFTLPT